MTKMLAYAGGTVIELYMNIRSLLNTAERSAYRINKRSPSV